MFARSLDWFERHKFGVVGALMLHTLMLFTMAMLKMDDGKKKPEPPPEIVLELEAPPEVQLTPEELQEQLAAQELQNRVSDVNAAPERSLSRSSQERISEQVDQDLKALEQSEFQRLAEERTAEGRDIVQPKLDPSKFDPKNYMEKKAQPVKVEGNVTVKIDVPGRTNTGVEVPAYLCKGRGQVRVRVTVDGSGSVSKAELDPTGTNTADDCLVSHALESANGARFESGAVARGTITYIFVAQ
ncbi:MAG TPA: hypothetical protein VHL57_06835 [Flavobacteriales bacterium]|jgi:hypothetical protein|nr:hypothetical protein [Flavobacteriales bacterium]